MKMANTSVHSLVCKLCPLKYKERLTVKDFQMSWVLSFFDAKKMSAEQRDNDSKVHLQIWLDQNLCSRVEEMNQLRFINSSSFWQLKYA